MNRYVPLSLIGSALFLCLAASAGQAAPVAGLTSTVHASVFTQAHWRHHHCWWRHHHRHCH
jgi:hypothetical protein